MASELEEKANFTRLSRLLVDKGTEALRKKFDAIHPPASLPRVLNANKKPLLRLKFRVIKQSQWDLLYPPSGSLPDSKKFDVTLLTVLFRNICGLTAPSTGWDKNPVDTERSVEANVARLKFYRNEFYAHVSSTKVDNGTFESLWEKISQSLVDLGISQNDVDDLKTCPLDPEEESYVEMLKEWKSREDECLKVLEGIQCSVDCVALTAEKNHDEIKQQLRQSASQQQHNFEALHSSITNISQVSKHTNLEKKYSSENDENLLQRLAKHNFKSKIERKAEFYHPGTREWLLKRVDEMVESEQKCRMLLLTAGPGFGKSVFTAKVCEEFKKKGKLAACHFCDFSDSNLRDPMMMVQSLASQMCENIVGFKEKLLDQLRRPHKMRSLKDAFGIYLRNPLDELDLKEPSLVVIDGLDESESDEKNEIVDLLADYFPCLPKCMKVLVTSRPEIFVAKLDTVTIEKINIENSDTNNDVDLKRYLEACLPTLPGSVLQNSANSQYQGLFAEHGVFKVLVAKCDGSFLYAFHLQSELLKRGNLDKITCDEIIEFLPQGLNSVYQKYFKRLEEELTTCMHKNINVLRILEMLAASEGYLPLDFITQALDLAPDCRETKKVINKINETVSCLLYVSDYTVTVFHKTVIDWLLAKGYKDHEYTVKVSDGNKLLWLMCEKVFEKVKDDVCSGQDLDVNNLVVYALYYGPRHLVACKMKESFFWLVDVVIIYALLAVYMKIKLNYVRVIFNTWVRVLHDVMDLDDKLRARLSWHVTEIEYLAVTECDRYWHCGRGSLPLFYLQSLLAHSPEGCFSEKEKETARLLALKESQFVELYFGQADVMPLAVWRFPSEKIGLDSHFSPASSAPEIKAVGLSNDKTKAAVAQRNGTITLLSLPQLVKLWDCSTDYKDTSCCTFAPDDSFVLFGKLETVLNIAEGKEVPFFHGNKETFTYCSFSPSGNRLVTSDGSDTVKLWDVAKKSLLSSLHAGCNVNWCSFSSTGLFIIGEWISDLYKAPKSEESTNEEDYDYFSESDVKSEDSKDRGFREQYDAFCVWNAITWQRSDEHNVTDIKLNDEELFHSKQCRRCFKLGFKEVAYSRKIKIKPFLPPKYMELPCSTGFYRGVECFVEVEAKHHYLALFSTLALNVMEHSHFSTLAAWNLFVHIPYGYQYCHFSKIAAIEDNIWFYTDVEKLILFRTKAPTQELPCPTKVYSSSFSPDGSRLATCTTDGYIKIWNVDTNKVEQRFKYSHCNLSFHCWWSDKFLFVFSFFDKKPSLSKYPVEKNLKILVTESKQVSLSHLLEEFVTFTKIVDFSNGLLTFKCQETDPVKVVDISGVWGPRLVTLPGIENGMSITVSPGASCVFGAHEYAYYLWKRNGKKEPVYEVLFNEPYEELYDMYYPDEFFDQEYSDPGEMEPLYCSHSFQCSFNSDSKVAVVLDHSIHSVDDSKIFDLDSGDHESVDVDIFPDTKFFFLNKDRVIITASHQFLKFFDMDSGALIVSSLQRYLTRDLVEQVKLSPKETVLAFPQINGDIMFRRLCIPQSPLLSSAEREAVRKR
jgi:WD40 repeat protein